MYALWQINLFSGSWKILGVTSTDANAKVVRDYLRTADIHHEYYIDYYFVVQFEGDVLE